MTTDTDTENPDLGSSREFGGSGEATSGETASSARSVALRRHRRGIGDGIDRRATFPPHRCDRRRDRRGRIHGYAHARLESPPT